MPRFTDEWVVDRVLFDYVAGGSCACCGGLANLFLPNGTVDLISAVSDLETNQMQREISILQQHHPFPLELRDQIWADRVKIRQKLKGEMKKYSNFWKEHGVEFTEWCYSSATIVQSCCQVSRSEILQQVHDKYNIHSAYGVVLTAVMEQVANFALTAYPPDAPITVSTSSSESPSTNNNNPEYDFELALQFNRMKGGFTLQNLYNATTQELNHETVQILLCRIQSLGGPKLLEKGSETEDGEISSPSSSSTTTTPSFQSDRRILRLLIARYWTNVLMERFLKDTTTTTITKTTTANDVDTGTTTNSTLGNDSNSINNSAI